MPDEAHSPKSEPKTALQAQLTGGASPLQKYLALAVGQRSAWALLRYELITCLAGPMPGAAGYVLRKLLYKRLLGSMGRGVVFGRGVVLRHPHKIHIGEGTVLDDNVVLDAKGETNRGIRLGRGVILSRGNVLSCKNGDIEIGDNTNIANGGLIHSEKSVRLGQNILVAALCYLVGGGSHDFDRTDVPIIQQPSLPARGIAIEDNAWLGARVTVLDGVTVGHDAVVGAGSLVLKDVPAWAIAVGSPARVVKSRAPVAAHEPGSAVTP
jgi:acetyltransferase-like isoleucine patch superfamily enzyme